METIEKRLKGLAQGQEEIGEPKESTIPSVGGWLQFGGILSTISMPM